MTFFCVFPAGGSVVHAAPRMHCSVPEIAEIGATCADPTLANRDRLILRAYGEAQRRAVDGGAFSVKRRFLDRRRRCGDNRVCILDAQVNALHQFEVMGSTVRLPLAVRSAAFGSGGDEDAGGPTAPATTLRELLDGIADAGQREAANSPPSVFAVDGGHATELDPSPAGAPQSATGRPQGGAAVGRAAMLIAPPDSLGATQVYVGEVAWTLRSAPPPQIRPNLWGHTVVPALSLTIDIDFEVGQSAAPLGVCFVEIAFHRTDPGLIGSVANIDLPRARLSGEALGRTIDGAKRVVSGERFIVGVLHASKRGPCGSAPGAAWMDFPLTLSSGLVGKITVELPSGSDSIAQAVR